MEHTIKQTNEGARINVIVEAEKQNLIIQEFTKCAAGTCSCPSPQYEKLESVSVSTQGSTITVDLKVLEGQVIDFADIERCLDHTAKQTGA